MLAAIRRTRLRPSSTKLSYAPIMKAGRFIEWSHVRIVLYQIGNFNSTFCNRSGSFPVIPNIPKRARKMNRVASPPEMLCTEVALFRNAKGQQKRSKTRHRGEKVEQAIVLKHASPNPLIDG